MVTVEFQVTNKEALLIETMLRKKFEAKPDAKIGNLCRVAIFTYIGEDLLKLSNAQVIEPIREVSD